MEKKEPKTAEWVLWILIAIVGAALLFTGVRAAALQQNVVVSTMCIVVGVILAFIGLIVMLGKANVVVKEKKATEPTKKKEKADK